LQRSNWLLERQNFVQHCLYLSVLHNYFDDLNKIIFKSVSR